MEWTTLCQDQMMNQNYRYHFALVVEQLYIKTSLSLIGYLFLKNCSSQFFSNWKSAEPVFCSEELSHLPYKNQNQNLTLSFGEGKFKFAVLWGLFIKSFFHWATFSKKKTIYIFFKSEKLQLCTSKGGPVEERLYEKTSQYSKFEFYLPKTES